MRAVRWVLAAACVAPLIAGEPAFPLFSDLQGKPYSVDYDARALRIDGERALFISGSLHYPRAPPEEWDGWLRDARANGLNMVEIYVFWNLHAPSEHGPGVWSGNANVTDFAQRAAAHGLFVYLRIGPYVCAEWTYGGVPLWLAQKPGVRFRETNPIWQAAMAAFFHEVLGRFARARLFAHQGGPLALVQVENELQPTDREYVDWCGRMATDALRAVGAGALPLTMCNGETADEAINTCNGEDCAPFLEQRGQSGRVLVDQPALWTEDEGGFALWGGSAAGEPSYFWGRRPGELAYNALRWFARGGSLLNYYMLAGGSNRGLWAGAALTTAYATDVTICHDGLRHDAKFHFLTLLHAALQRVAPALLAEGAAARAEAVEAARHAQGPWVFAPLERQRAYAYGAYAFVENNADEPVFVRFLNHTCTRSLRLSARSAALVARCEAGAAEAGSGAAPASLLRMPAHADERKRTPTTGGDRSLRSQNLGEAEPAAAELHVLFRSDGLAPGAPLPPEHRALAPLRAPSGATAPPLSWRQWREPIATPAPIDIGANGPAIHSRVPIEQGQVTRDKSAFATYARHSTTFAGACAAAPPLAEAAPAGSACVLAVEVGCANALTALVDGVAVGHASELSHDPCNATLNLTLDTSHVAPGKHTLVLVSEHLGYANYGFRSPLLKGLIGKVELGGREITRGAWIIRAGLDGERLRLMTRQGAAAVNWTTPPPQAAPPPPPPPPPAGGPGGRAAPLTWYRATFSTPPELVGDERARLHVNMSGFGRGHAWVNGHSLGRYWLKARTTGPEAGTRPTQALYHVPTSYLHAAGVGSGAASGAAGAAPNVLTVLESLGARALGRAALYVATLAPGAGPHFNLDAWLNKTTDCEM